MTTRLQRERLKPLTQIDGLIDDEFVAGAWSRAYPKQPLPANFPNHARSCVRASLELALVPSTGEVGRALNQLHNRLMAAIRLDDRKPAATALEQMPESVLVYLQHRFPGQIPLPDDIRGSLWGIDLAKGVLGFCVAGAEIAPGRLRPSGRQSRPMLRILPRYKQRPGHPRHEAEMMLVRSIGEYFYNRDGRFPGLRSHGGQFAPDSGPFARLVTEILDRIGARSVNATKLIQRCLHELPARAPLSANNGQSPKRPRLNNFSQRSATAPDRTERSSSDGQAGRSIRATVKRVGDGLQRSGSARRDAHLPNRNPLRTYRVVKTRFRK